MSAITSFVQAGTLAFTPIEVDGLFIDGFAGGGGASTGIEQAIGRSVDHAINHSETAIAIHRANHPSTKHHCTDIRMPFLPQQVTNGRYVAGAWFSPDCKEFSKAKGGPVKDRSIRALCWEVVTWLKDVRPTCGYLENVEEFEYVAPLDEAGNPIKGQEGREFKRFVKAIRALGYRVQWRILRACDYGAPTSRKRLYMVMRCDGQAIVWPKPTHGAPGSAGVRSGKLLRYRTAAECIDWTISCPSIFERQRELADATKRRIAHGIMRYVVNAAEPFIVPVTNSSWNPDRAWPASEPLRTVTTARGGEMAAVDVAVAPHVMTNRNSAKPFTAMDEPTHTITAGGAHQNLVGATLVRTGHGEADASGKRRGKGHHDLSAPMPTVTSSRDEAIAGATLVKMGNGEREGQDPRALDPGKPLGTVTAKGSQAAAVTAFLSSFYGSDKRASGGDLDDPLRTVRARGQHHAVVAAHVEQANTGMVGHDARKPLSTIVGKGCTQRIVETTMVEEDALPPHLMERAVKVVAFLVKYYATDGENEASQVQQVDRPLDTITVKARFAVVTVTIDAKTYVIVDIGLRMLKPRELARAQGFPDSYILNPVVRKFLRGKWVERPLTIAEQISAIGNSVCPPVARALVAANQPSSAPMRLAA